MDKKYRTFTFNITPEDFELLKEQCRMGGYEDNLSLYIRHKILPKPKAADIEEEKDTRTHNQKLKDQYGHHFE